MFKVSSLNILKPTPRRCEVYIYFSQAISILPYFVWACKSLSPFGANSPPIITAITVFSSMRAYALSRRHWVLSATILALSLVPTGINYVSAFTCMSSMTIHKSLPSLGRIPMARPNQRSHLRMRWRPYRVHLSCETVGSIPLTSFRAH